MRVTVKRITDIVSDSGLIQRGSSVLCAVSGGADSMCLLHCLFENRKEFGISVAAAHFDHCIRGEESSGDAAFVEAFCREKGIPFCLGRENVPEYAAAHALGTEEAARKLRYEFLERAAEEAGCGFIATAHNLCDNAETVLFNLTRGTGPAGLKGIPAGRGRIIRPLLAASREDIEQYLKENAVPHVEDSTNASDDYSRNLIRHKVVPVLREINPEFFKAVRRTGAVIARDEDFISQQAELFIRDNFDGLSVPLKELGELHPAVSSRVIRRLCPRTLTFEHVEAVLGILSSQELTRLSLPGITVTAQCGRLMFAGENISPLQDTEIVPGKCTEIPRAGLRVYAEYEEFPDDVHGLLTTFHINCAEINGRLLITSRRAGDTLRPYRRGCTKTLKSLFLEKGLTSPQRASVPVLRDDKGPLAVYGIAVSERSVPKPGDRALRITFINTTGDSNGK